MDAFAELIGTSPGIREVQRQVARLLERPPDSRRFPPILIQGETGTGKGLLARLIHRAGPRAQGPFVEINCAAIPETLLEAELFGYERGAFTDARQAKAGLFQAANGGSLFLDEIGLLPEGLQAKLLSVIEERSVRRLGSTRSERVDAWIISATNEDLSRATRERRFREDLYHRLSVVTLRLPPLRERPEDIVPLAEHFLARACAEYELAQKHLSDDARAALGAYPWPGNVRELGNVIERMALLSEASVVTAETLGLPALLPAEAGAVAPPGGEPSLEDVVGSVERARIAEVLRAVRGNVTHAAQRLGISRNTLRYRMDKYGLRQGAVPPRHPREAARPVAPAPPPPEAAPAPVGVRWEPRRVTLLRVVLPAAASPLAGNRSLEVFVDKVQGFGGRVEELSPDGIVAAFGLEPVEDAPRRAAHAAMAIRRAAERRADASPLGVTIGIHVDQFLVGRTAAGAQIDLNAKHEAWAALDALVAGAEPGTIAASEAAAPFLERRFDLQPAPAPTTGARRVYRLSGRERPGLGVGRRMARFVGREHDLELLRTRLASARRGRGQAVGVLGEAGIGKSRLLFEFRQRLAPGEVTYLKGRCVSYGATIPYLPVLGILRRAFRLAEPDPADVVEDKVRAGLTALGLDPGEIAPYILHLLAVKTDQLAPLSPEAVKGRTLETLRQMLLKGSRVRPIVFEVEDLQWIDRTSEEYVASLVESLHAAPVLFITTYRPGYRPTWLDKSYATQIALQPLAPDDSLAVVRSVLGPAPVPESLAGMILDKAEGNPFFLEELSRAVKEQGPASAVAVPDTVQEVLLARIDRLPDEARRALQTAAVLGREVPLGLLAAIWDGPGDVAGALRELTRLEFLSELGGPGEVVHAFRHSLTQEVAYASLDPVRRRQLHAAAARAMETAGAERLEGAWAALAYHYARTDDAPKAVEYLGRFAEKAARGSAHEEAVQALREAQVHAERLPAAEDRDRRLLDLALREATSLFPLGRFKRILDLLLRQQERLERVGDARLASHYHFVLGQVYTFLGDQARVARSAERAIEEARRCGDEATMGKAYCLLALEAPLTGDPRRGLEHGRRAVALLERAAERWWLGQAHWLVGLNHAQLGDFELALEAEGRAQGIADTLGDPRLATSVAWVTGIIYAAIGEWEKGIAECQRSLRSALDPLNRAVAMGWLGFAYLQNGDVPQAIPALEEAARQLGHFGFRQFQGWFTVFLAEAHRLAQRPDKAEELGLEALRISREANFAGGVGWARHTLGRTALARGALREAGAHLGEAREVFSAIGARWELGRTHLDLAALARARGDLGAAQAHLGEAHVLFQAPGLLRYQERAERLARELGVSLR